MITFQQSGGNLPDLVATSSLSSSTGNAALNVYTDGTSSPLHSKNTSVIGTKEHVECNNRGTCDRTTGICNCYQGFASSNGDAVVGLTGDCGYYNGSNLQFCPKAIPVWGSTAAVCSGVGKSCSSDFICNCTTGYTGPACEYKQCPRGNSWFDETTALGAHRNGSSCSNGGVCSESSGSCTCGTAFEGVGCHKLSCPTDVDGNICGNTRGTCLTMKNLAKRSRVNGELIGAKYETEWDAAKVQGCYCHRSNSSTNIIWGREPDDIDVIHCN